MVLARWKSPHAWLVAFIPLVIASGGNSGNQTLTLLVRSLALGQVTSGNQRRLVLKEISIAVLNGVVWGGLAGMLTWLLYRDTPNGALLGIVALFFLALKAANLGNFSTEGAQLLGMPWGIVSLVDLYTGFTLFSAWIIYREKSLPAAIAWTIAMMVLGFFAGSLYAFIALQNSGNDWRKFWLGKHA